MVRLCYPAKLCLSHLFLLLLTLFGSWLGSVCTIWGKVGFLGQIVLVGLLLGTNDYYASIFFVSLLSLLQGYLSSVEFYNVGFSAESIISAYCSVFLLFLSGWTLNLKIKSNLLTKSLGVLFVLCSILPVVLEWLLNNVLGFSDIAIRPTMNAVRVYATTVIFMLFTTGEAAEIKNQARFEPCQDLPTHALLMHMNFIALQYRVAKLWMYV